MDRNALPGGVKIAAAAAAVAVGLGLGGWAAAGAWPQHESASAGRVLEVRYEVRREPAYVPPEPTEATRLDVLSPVAVAAVDGGVLDAQSDADWRSLRHAQDREIDRALADIRAEDARIDREMRDAMRDLHRDPDTRDTRS